MEINTANPAKRWGLFLAALAVGIAISIPAFHIWLADHWDTSDDPQLWVRAAKLEPGNALLLEHLGRYREFDFEHSDSKQAIAYLKRATEVDPGYDRLWMELAESEESAGQFAAAKDDFENGRDAHPTSADVRWRFGNYLVRQGDREWGFNEIQKALSDDPTLTQNAITVCWEASHSVPELLSIAPENSGAFYGAALNFFLNRAEVSDALQVWNRIAGSGEYFAMDGAIPLVNALVNQGDADAASKAWAEAIKVSGWEHDTNAAGSLVFNGGFENDIANGGLGWQEIPIPGAVFTIDETAPHSGKQSLKIVFDGSSNIAFANLQQAIPVKPNQKYEFSAFIKTEGLTTDSGIQFDLRDSKHAATVHASTRALIGTSAWTQLQTQITAGAETHFLTIALTREASSKLDNKFAGTVWIDDVSLRAAAEISKGATK